MRAYRIRAITLVIAPYQHTLSFKHVRDIVDEKYKELDFFEDVRPSEKLDRAFDRWLVGAGYKPVLYGNTIYGGIKRALKTYRKPLPIKVSYAMFNEEDIGVYVFQLTNAAGKQTLVQVEALRSGAEGVLVGDLSGLGVKKLVIQVGPLRKFGFGLLEIEAEESGTQK